MGDTEGSQYVKLQPDSGLQRDTLERWLKKKSLCDRVSTLTFTPFLGLGTLQTDLPENIPWDKAIKDRWTETDKDGEAHKIFVDRIQYLRADGREFVEASYPDSITEARVALTEAALAATQLYSTLWAKGLEPVVDWRRHGVRLPDADMKRLRDALQVARTALDRLDDIPAFSLLGATGLSARLKALYDELGRSRTLQSSVVEYLTDAFWHSMTFDAPIYPRYDELAMQVSLCLGEDHPRRRMVPPSAVERSEYVNFTKRVQQSMNRGFQAEVNQDSTRARFYAAVAQTLHASQTWRRDTPLLLFKTPGMKDPIEPILAVSSTFDLELERALAMTGPVGGIYHVAIPVYVEVDRRKVHERATGDANLAELWWIVGDFKTTPDRALRLPDLTRPANADVMQKLDPEAGCDDLGPAWRWLDLASANTLDGPLVLKINGSPLHVFDHIVEQNPGLKKLPPHLSLAKGGRMYHAILLDEIDFIQSAHVDSYAFAARQMNDASGRGLPDWLMQTLSSKNRYWLLLGQRLSDWASKLHLFLQVSRLRPDAGRFVDVAKEVDADRVRLLSWAGINSVQGDCRNLIEPLEELTEQLTR